MKKFFASVLAVSMVMSMAAVSFADEETHEGVHDVIGTAFKYSADGNTMKPMVIEYGKAAYFPIIGYEKGDYQVVASGDGTTANLVLTSAASGNPHMISDQDVVDGLKVKLEIEQGKELIADNGVSIVKKQVANIGTYNAGTKTWTVPSFTTRQGDTADFSTLGGYYYFVEIKTVAKETTSDADLIATIELNKSKKGDDTVSANLRLTGDSVAKPYPKDLIYKVKDLKTDITTNVGYENSYVNAAGADTIYKVIDDISDGNLDAETYYLLKYDYDDEVEFGFGTESGGQNEGTFTVDVSGQGKNLMYWDTIVDEAIAAANPTAGKLFALNFNNTKFNRTGEFMYEGEDFEYAYEVMADGTLKLLGEFDGEEVTFKTRILGKYLFSDVELVAAPAAVEDVVPSVDAPIVDVTNPATGAAA